MPNNKPIKRRDWLIIALGASIIAVLAIITINEVSPPTKKKSEGVSSPKTQSAQTYQVEYKVIGVGCDIWYTNATGGTDRLEDITGPWSKTITAKVDDFLNLSAQNGPSNDLSVTVTIKVNGKVFASETSNGKFAIADVSCTPGS